MGIFSAIKDFFTPDPEIDFQLGLREEIFSQNYAKAAWLYQKAIDRGHHKAKYFLAVLYLMGRGVAEDRNKAIALLRQSADAGYDKAKTLLSDIEAENFSDASIDPSRIQSPVRIQRSAKVLTCIRTIESDLLKRTLSDQEENNVAELCSGLLSMALGDEKIVIRLVRLEWTESTDVVDAFRRAQDRWERDHNRFG
jgi:hypothetical protein